VAFASPGNSIFRPAATKGGTVQDIMVECDITVGPDARDRWREMARFAKDHGTEVEEFAVGRFRVWSSLVGTIEEANEADARAQEGVFTDGLAP